MVLCQSFFHRGVSGLSPEVSQMNVIKADDSKVYIIL